MTSFQSLRRSREAESFVGREKELSSFDANLRRTIEDPHRYFILNVSGQGGMGKTTFLTRCRQIATSAGSTSAWTDHSDTDLLETISSLAHSLGEHGSAVTERCRAYKTRRAELEAAADAPEGLHNFLSLGLARRAVRLGTHIPGAGIALDFLGEEEAATQLIAASAFISRKLKTRDVIDLVTRPIDVLSPLLVGALTAAAIEAKVGLFLDTYEATQHYTESWLLELLDGEYGDVPADIVITIAGREQLDSNTWAAYTSMTKRIHLERFTNAEVRELLQRQGVTHEADAREIIRLAEGLPLLVATLATQPRTDVGDAEALGTATERFLRGIPDDHHREFALACSLPRVLNEDVAYALFGEAGRSTFSWLTGLPFVRRSGGYWRYHEVVRRPLLNLEYARSPERWQRHHAVLAEYWEGRAAREAGGSHFALDATYHGILGMTRRTADVLGEFLMLWRVDPLLARPLAEVVTEADSVIGRRALGNVLLQAVTEYERGHAEPAREVYAQALAGRFGDLSPDLKALVFACRADDSRQLWALQAALDDLDGALALSSASKSLILYDRARLYAVLGRFADALVDIEAVLDSEESSAELRRVAEVFRARLFYTEKGPEAALELLDPLVATHGHPVAWLTRGQANRSLGRTDDAVADFHRAVEASPDLEHEGYKEIGISFVRAGRWGDAESALRRSLEAEPACHHCWETLAGVLTRRWSLDELPGKLTEAYPATDSRVLAAKAAALDAVGLGAAARCVYEEALRADAHNIYARRAFAELLAALGDVGEGLRQVAVILDEQPNFAPALLTRAELLAEQGERDRAATAYDRAVGLDPRIPATATNSHGLLLSRLGRYVEALRVFESLDDSRRHDAVVQYNVAVATGRAGTGDGANDTIRLAREALSGLDEAGAREYGLAGLAAVEGNTEDALAGLRNALALTPVARRWVHSDPAWDVVRSTEAFRLIVSVTEGATG